MISSAIINSGLFPCFACLTTLKNMYVYINYTTVLLLQGIRGTNMPMCYTILKRV